MYKTHRNPRTTIDRNTSYNAETLEQKVDRILNNKEPITDGAPLIYTERSKGVDPNLNVRTDRMEYAVEAMDKLSKSNLARRQARMDALKPKDKDKESGASDIPATK